MFLVVTEKVFLFLASILFIATSGLTGLAQTNTHSSTNEAMTPLATTNQALAYVPDDTYRLRVGDRVSFQILEDRDLPKILVVADSGELEVPYIGRIPVLDKTCKQVVQECKVQLEKDYYYRASVILALDTANRLLGRVYVWGQVRAQGVIELAVNDKITAGKAIVRAGGFADFANKKKVRVVRGGNAGGMGADARQTFELNMVEILEQGRTELDFALQPDDIVIVPSRLINF